jgi:hypothetical protein
MRRDWALSFNRISSIISYKFVSYSFLVKQLSTQSAVDIANDIRLLVLAGVANYLFSAIAPASPRDYAEIRKRLKHPWIWFFYPGVPGI